MKNVFFVLLTALVLPSSSAQVSKPDQVKTLSDGGGGGGGAGNGGNLDIQRENQYRAWLEKGTLKNSLMVMAQSTGGQVIERLNDKRDASEKALLTKLLELDFAKAIQNAVFEIDTTTETDRTAEVTAPGRVKWFMKSLLRQKPTYQEFVELGAHESSRLLQDQIDPALHDTNHTFGPKWIKAYGDVYPRIMEKNGLETIFMPTPNELFWYGKSWDEQYWVVGLWMHCTNPYVKALTVGVPWRDFQQMLVQGRSFSDIARAHPGQWSIWSENGDRRWGGPRRRATDFGEVTAFDYEDRILDLGFELREDFSNPLMRAHRDRPLIDVIRENDGRIRETDERTENKKTRKR